MSVDYKYHATKRWVWITLGLVALSLLLAPIRATLMFFSPSTNRKLTLFFSKLHKENFEKNTKKVHFAVDKEA